MVTGDRGEPGDLAAPWVKPRGGLRMAVAGSDFHHSLRMIPTAGDGGRRRATSRIAQARNGRLSCLKEIVRSPPRYGCFSEGHCSLSIRTLDTYPMDNSALFYGTAFRLRE